MTVRTVGGTSIGWLEGRGLPPWHQKGYNPLSGNYIFRRMVRAVLVEVKHQE